MCVLTFSFQPHDNVTQTFNLSITSWLHNVSLPPRFNTNGCSLSDDLTQLIITPAPRTSGFNPPQSTDPNQPPTYPPTPPVLCQFVKNPGIAILQMIEPSYGVTFPSLVYYQQQFSLTPLTSSCTDPSSSTDCSASLTFPVLALPFVLKTTNTFDVNSIQCKDENSGDTIPTTGSTKQLSIIQRTATPSSPIISYDFSIALTMPRVFSIVCTTLYTKSTQPVYRIEKPSTNILLFSSTIITQTELNVAMVPNCINTASNTCTLIYEMPNSAGILPPTSAFSPAFASAISSPLPCPDHIVSTRPPNYTYTCQTFTKYLQYISSPLEEDIITISNPVNNNDNNLYFRGGDYENLTIPLDLSNIVYKTPLIYSFDATSCNDKASSHCPLTVKSLHQGPILDIRMTFPFTGVVEEDGIKCSKYMSFDPSTRLIQFPGFLSSVTSVPSPRDVYTAEPDGINTDNDGELYHYCTFNIAKAPFTLYNTINTYSIAYYSEIPRFSTNRLAPESALEQIVLTETFHRLPFDITTDNDCTNRDSEWCSVIFTPFDPINYPPRGNIRFSVQGLVDGVGLEDWSVHVEEDDAFATASISSEQIIYNHISNPTTIALGLPTQCQPDSRKRCRPGTPLRNLDDCVPVCDHDDPDNPTNPCNLCRDDINLFTLHLSGIVRTPVTFKYRKKVWERYYKNVIYLYSYNGIPFDNNLRIGIGEFNPITFQPDSSQTGQLVVEYYPPYAITWQNCADVSNAFCTGFVSRRDLSILHFWYSVDQTNFFTDSDSISGSQVYDPIQEKIIRINYTPVPPIFPYTTLSDFPFSFQKDLGVNSITSSISHEVGDCPPGTDTGDITVTKCIVGLDKTFTQVVKYENDAMPIFGEDCTEISSEYCSITYKITTPISAFDNTVSQCYPGSANDGQCYLPYTIISHYLPHRNWIYDINFDQDKLGPKESYQSTTRRDQSARRPHTILFPLSFEPSCVGDWMDSETKVELNWEDGCENPQDTACQGIRDPSFSSQFASMLTLRLLSGEFPYGATCHIKLTKRSASSPSRRTRLTPAILLNQPSSTYKHLLQGLHYISIPPIQWARVVVMAADRDCITQHHSLKMVSTCTMHMKFYASRANPLYSLHLPMPDDWSHPFLLHSDTARSLLRNIGGKLIEVGKVKVTDTTGNYIMNDDNNNDDDHNIDVIDNHNNNNNNNNNNNTTFQPQSGERSIVITMSNDWTEKDVDCTLVITATSLVPSTNDGSELGVPQPTGTTSLPFVLNGGQTNTLPFLNLPSTISGLVLLVGSNITSTTTQQPWIRLQYNFNYDKIVKVTIDQSFGIYNKDVPCYRSNSLTKFIPYDQFLTNEQSITEGHEIVAWFRTDRATQKTTLTPIDPTVMIGVQCYTYFKTTRSTKAVDVEHIITIKDEFDIYYYGGFPGIVSTAAIIPIESTLKKL